MRVFSKDLLMKKSGAQELPWIQPIVTTGSGANNTITTPEGTVYSCWDVRSSGYQLSNCFDGSTAETAGCPIERSATGYDWVQIYNPIPIKSSKIDIYWRSYSTGRTITATVTIEASNDGTNWTTLSSGTTSTSTTITDIVKHTVDLSSNGNFYNYYKIENTTPYLTSYRYYWYITEIEITATYQA